MGDYHNHLHPHGPWDGRGPAPGDYPLSHIEAYVEAAASRGWSEVGFTEHLFRCEESAPVLGEFWLAETGTAVAAHSAQWVPEDRVLSLDAYVTAVVDARDRGYPVLLGLEVDFFPETIGAVMELLEPYPWDMLIGSTHWLGAWSVDHPGQSGHLHISLQNNDGSSAFYDKNDEKMQIVHLCSNASLAQIAFRYLILN